MWPSKLHRTVELLLLADYCSILAPGTSEEQRAWVETRTWAGSKRGIISSVARGAMRLTWPLRASRWSIANVRRFGQQIAERDGKPVRLQLIEQFRHSLRTGKPPRHYYDYELYGNDAPHRFEFIAQHEVDEVRWALEGGRIVPLIQDKQLFGEFCLAHDIATPILLNGSQAVEHAEIFCKPSTGRGGIGTELWSRQADGDYLAFDGERLPVKRLVGHLEERRRAGWLIQPHLRNQREIDDLSEIALCTARMVTGRTPDGDVQLVAATFKMPRLRRIISTHGINSPIELQSGRLGRAYSYSPICPGYDRHPMTGATITGRVLPLWPDALAIVDRAHRLITEHMFVGWDVAFTPQGVMLLEGNSGWDVLTVQKPQRTPLTRTCFVDICRMWAR